MKTADLSRPALRSTEPPGSAKVRLTISKIRDAHLEKLAIVYVRQSSPQQVLENRESTARQYALGDYAQALGWPAERVVVSTRTKAKAARGQITARAIKGF